MIAAGNTVTDISKVYQSYASAVILLQNCFFFPAETFLTEDIVNQQPPKPPLPGTLQSPESTFSKYLLSGEEEPCGQFLEELFGYYNGNLTFMPNQIRDLYYQLFSILSAARKKNQVESGFHEKQDLIVDTLDNAFTYEELHESLKEKTAQYFEDAKLLGKHFTCEALVDSGNLLKDPLGNNEVIIVKSRALKGIISDELVEYNYENMDVFKVQNIISSSDEILSSRVRLIPYKHAGSNSGSIILGIKADYIEIDKNKISNVVIGLSNFDDSEYDAILNPNILQGI